MPEAAEERVSVRDEQVPCHSQPEGPDTVGEGRVELR